MFELMLYWKRYIDDKWAENMAHVISYYGIKVHLDANNVQIENLIYHWNF